jgi:peptidoglycan/LPS O-acetylase OafA/YrhL
MATEVRSLTGLRGIAAVAVVLYHFKEMTPLPASPLSGIVSRGYLAVDVFFVLSGFVMALTYARGFASGFNTITYRDFLLRRFARIYPLYALVLVGMLVCIGCGLCPGSNLRNSLAAIIANVLLVQAWGVAGSINGPAWSISTEFAAYLLFPMLLKATLFGDGQRTTWAGIAAAGFLTIAAMAGPYLQPSQHGMLDLYCSTNPLALIRCLVGFTFGLLTYRGTTSPAIMRLAKRDLAMMTVITLFVAALLLDVGDLVVYPLVPPLVLCAYANHGRPARLLGHGITYRLGTLSYAIYLLHKFVLWGVAQTLSASCLVVDATAFAVLLALAIFAHHVVELPGRRLIRGWSLPRRRSAVA